MKSGSPVFLRFRHQGPQKSCPGERRSGFPLFPSLHLVFTVLVGAFLLAPMQGSAQPQPPPAADDPPILIEAQGVPEKKVITPSPSGGERKRLITLDFNNVEIPVFVKFVSEIIGKNFIIDERVRGKVTIFSPAKISVDKVYQVFLAVLELKGLAAVESGGMIKILPVNEVPPDRDIQVYYLQNANAEETAKLLTSVVTRAVVSAKAGRPSPVSRADGSGQIEGVVQIIPDKATNALLITASPNDYELLKKVIEKLDIQRKQVYVEAVIMEVAQENLRDIGTEIGAVGLYQTPDEETLSGIGAFNEAPETLLDIEKFGTSSNNVNFGISSINVKVLMRALQSSSDVNVLSTPQILTTNNQKAKIVVGQEVPFVTSTSQTTGALTQRNISREDVGVTLEITPEILEGDRVRMDIRQEISTLVETPDEVLIELGPTKNKREATTSVIVGNRQTVVIGGLIRDDETNSVRKIPLLGDIPFLGYLFKVKTKRYVKTNLLIFLTPEIIRDNLELDQIREDKSRVLQQAVSRRKIKGPSVKEEFFDRINPPELTR